MCRYVDQARRANDAILIISSVFLTDIDECVEAALNSNMICNRTMECINNPGNFSCRCPGNTELMNGECIEIG